MLCTALQFKYRREKLKGFRFVRPKREKKFSGKGRKFAAVEGDRTTETRDTKDPVPLTYPKYVLRDLLRMPVSRAPSARGELHECLLFPVASALGWRAKRGPPAAESCCYHTRDGWSSCLSALSASPLYNYASRQKVGMLAAKDPHMLVAVLAVAARPQWHTHARKCCADAS